MPPYSIFSFLHLDQKFAIQLGRTFTSPSLLHFRTSPFHYAIPFQTSPNFRLGYRSITMSAKVSTQLWDGKATQEELMHKDECILVDDTDTIVGHASKYAAHQFNSQQPQGILHRAFSVFLFNSTGHLLLQQRAASKITFPNVWTNTCCSHPLYGYTPTEVDQPEDLINGLVPGVKHAAVRKLMHELGITLPVSSLKFLTRLHYCARDTGTWGADAEWGEHEIDYVLFAQTEGEDDIPMTPNADEVGNVCYVSLDQLKEMMDEKSGLLWSPWFKIIAKNFLETWWNDLDGAIKGNKYLDIENIHRIES